VTLGRPKNEAILVACERHPRCWLSRPESCVSRPERREGGGVELRLSAACPTQIPYMGWALPAIKVISHLEPHQGVLNLEIER
jgi:hypothetical protein